MENFEKSQFVCYIEIDHLISKQLNRKSKILSKKAKKRSTKLGASSIKIAHLVTESQ